MRDGLPFTPLTTDDVLTCTADTLKEAHSVDDRIYWIGSSRSQGWRRTINAMLGDKIVDLTPGKDVSNSINEYGGGAFDVDSSWLVFNDSLENRVYAIRHGEIEYPITLADPKFRYGGFRLAADQNIVLAVREDHHGPGEHITEIVALDLHTTNDDGGRVLCTGADFYGRPAYCDGRIAWCQWDHPNMPWDDTQIWVMSDDLAPRQVAGGAGISAINPLFLDDKRLAWFDDSAGFWNVTIEDGTKFIDPHDHCPAPWKLIEPPLTQLNPTTLLGLRYVDGVGKLTTFHLDTAQVNSLDLGISDVDSICGGLDGCFAIVTWPNRPSTLCRFDQDGLHELTSSIERIFSAPESIWFDGPSGPTQAWLYPAVNSKAPSPTLVVCHGGPTGMASSDQDMETQFWCSNGIQVLSVNYSGSSGFGRKYRQRLNSQWGVADVADIIAAVEVLIKDGRVDAKRIAIAGGSAGGYTVLRALTNSNVFTAGISSYGIADLEVMTRDTHKFESRYMDRLVGKYPQQRQIYFERSPINQVDQIFAPMLLLQGSEDRVVPLNQAEMMAQALRSNGREVELIIFDGEGHGFRKPENQKRAFEARLSFLTRIWRLNSSPST